MQTPVKAKGWLTSKTNIIAILVIVIGAVQQLAEGDILPAEYRGAVLSAVGIVMFVMRAITKQPVSASPLESSTQYVEAAQPGAK